jgi:hypothetical protein
VGAPEIGLTLALVASGFSVGLVTGLALISVVACVPDLIASTTRSLYVVPLDADAGVPTGGITTLLLPNTG